ncbi:histidine kinase [Streptococcus hongkongensis]|nr:histidine kinase [Streptococcus uberis]
MPNSLSLILVFVVRFGVAWFVFFDMEYSVDRKNRKIPWGQISLFVLFEMTIIGFIGSYYLLVEPLMMFVYHYIKYPKDNIIQHIFFSQFPVVVTDLFAKISLYFIIPFVVNSSVGHVQQNYNYIIVSYLAVVPIMRYLARIFSIDSFIFLRFDTRLFNRFIVGIELIFFLYYTLSYSALLIDASMNDYKKSVVLIFFMIFVCLLSFLNHYFQKNTKTLIQLEEEKHIQLLEQYNQYLETLYQNIRSFRHDYDNILISLSGAIESGDFSVIKPVYHQIVGKMDDLVDYEALLRLDQLDKIDNFDMKILLALKIYEARQNGTVPVIEVKGNMANRILEDKDDIVIISAIGDLAILMAKDLSNGFIDIYYDMSKPNWVSLKVLTNAEKLKTKERKYILTEIEKAHRTFINLVEKYPNFSYDVRAEGSVFIQEVVIIRSP